MALDPKEERTLRQIELALERADPHLAERMHDPWSRRRLCRLVGVCLLACAIALACVRTETAVVAHTMAGALFFAAGLCFGQGAPDEHGPLWRRLAQQIRL